MKKLTLAIFLLAAAAALALPAAPARAEVDQELLVNRALGSVERLRTDDRFKKVFEPALAKSVAVLIVPDLYKGGFILGGQFGNGVLLAKKPDGSWSYPGFYALSGGSIGLQLGAEDISIAFAILTEKGLDAILENKFKVGAEMQVALAVVGGGAEAATTANAGRDIEAYAFGGIGLYGSLSLEGAAITPRETWNEAYYGKKVAGGDVVMKGAAQNQQADKLRDFLAH